MKSRGIWIWILSGNPDEIVLENNKIHRFFSILLDLCDTGKKTV